MSRLLLICIALVFASCGSSETTKDGDSWSFGEPGEVTEDPCGLDGCEQMPDDDPVPNVVPPSQTQTDPPTTDPPNTQPPDEPAPVGAVLEGTYVAGNLGYYQSCPEEGLPSPDADGERDGDGVCDGEDCWTCEHGVVMVNLSNVGDLTALDVQVVGLDLYDAEGVYRTALPILDIVEVDTLSPPDVELAPDQERMLRVNFRGPANPLEYLSEPDGDSSFWYYGIVHIHVASANAEPITIISTEVDALPDIDT